MYRPNVLPERLADFKRVYREELTRCIQKWPEEYAYGVEDVDPVVEKMCRAIQEGTAHKGRAVSATLRRLRVNDTYKALNAFLTGEN